MRGLDTRVFHTMVSVDMQIRWPILLSSDLVMYEEPLIRDDCVPGRACTSQLSGTHVILENQAR